MLASAYGFSKDVVAGTLDQVLATAEFEVEDRSAATAALGDFRASKADYADCLIARRNALAACEETVTFDRAPKALPGFRRL